jgi:hypothetical protein
MSHAVSYEEILAFYYILLSKLTYAVGILHNHRILTEFIFLAVLVYLCVIELINLSYETSVRAYTFVI